MCTASSKMTPMLTDAYYMPDKGVNAPANLTALFNDMYSKGINALSLQFEYTQMNMH